MALAELGWLMRLLRTTLLSALVAIPLLDASQVQAYDASKTHRWLTRQAVEYLVAAHPGEYDEILEYMEEIIEGAFHEDDMYADGDQDPTTLRVMRHFYHAPDQAGLTYGENGEFPNSFEWNGIASEENKWDYHDGLLAYQKGLYAEAFFIAGHTVHLIEDLTVPAHSHLDEHGPPYGDNYEQHCRSRTTSSTESSLKVPVPGTPLPQFSSLADAFQRTADASYYRNFYPGYLSDEGEAFGVIKDMFPEISLGWLSGEWSIPGVGKLSKGFHEEAPGYFYFSINEVTSAFDVVDYDAANPHDRQFAPMASNAHMVERMADDLTPIAILHSASVIKMFVDEARGLPPVEEETDAPSLDDMTEAAGCSLSSGNGGLLSALSLLLLIVAFRRQD
jgi:hypothetical protein